MEASKVEVEGVVTAVEMAARTVEGKTVVAMKGAPAEATEEAERKAAY